MSTPAQSTNATSTATSIEADLATGSLRSFLDNVLGVDPKPVLGGRFPLLAFL